MSSEDRSFEDLQRLQERLESSVAALAGFEGLEGELVDFHTNLRTQFAEFRAKIDELPTSPAKSNYLAQNDALVKKMHSHLLNARNFARQRTAQLSREELFRLSQTRHQQRLATQAGSSPEDRIGEEVTASLRRMLDTMRGEVERSAANIDTAKESSKHVSNTASNYQSMAGNIDESKKLVRDLRRKNRHDRLYVLASVGFFLAVVAWIVVMRLGLDRLACIPGLVLKHATFAKSHVKGILQNILDESTSTPAHFAGKVDGIQLDPHPGPEHEIFRHNEGPVKSATETQNQHDQLETPIQGEDKEADSKLATDPTEILEENPIDMPVDVPVDVPVDAPVEELVNELVPEEPVEERREDAATESMVTLDESTQIKHTENENVPVHGQETVASAEVALDPVLKEEPITELASSDELRIESPLEPSEPQVEPEPHELKIDTNPSGPSIFEEKEEVKDLPLEDRASSSSFDEESSSNAEDWTDKDDDSALSITDLDEPTSVSEKDEL